MVTALTAAAGLEALNKGEFELVLSDVVLADGMSGPKFAEQARALYPSLKVIFMSGYPAETAGFINADEVLINKPFKRQDLAKVLRNTLA
ncbi:MAG: two-component SAPR family response regulator [Alphaproteobacteria bacterium]